MDAETATTVLTILGSSFGAILAALITLMVASIRIQHRDNLATRQLIADASKENRDLIDRNRNLIVTNHVAVIRMHGDTRERLARIEGHLGIGLPASDDPASDDPVSDGDSREAA